MRFPARLVLEIETQKLRNMKTFYILALTLAMAMTPAIGNAHEATHTDSIAKKIQSSVTLLASCQEDENQRVFVVFSIAENGAVAVHEVGTANPELKASIVAQFQAMQFDNAQNSYDGMYSIWLNFKTL